MYAGMFALAILGYALNQLFNLVQRSATAVALGDDAKKG